MYKLCYVNSRRTSEIKGDRPSYFCDRNADLLSADPGITVLDSYVDLFFIKQLVWCHAILNMFWLLYLYINGNYLNITFQTWKFTEMLIWKESKIILVNSFKINWHLKSLGKLSFHVCGLYKAACCILFLMHEMITYFIPNKWNQKLKTF